MRYGASANLRALLLSGAVCATASLFVTAVASADDKVEKVTVTGTRIRVPSTVSNLAFGGRNRARLFICASHTLYAIYTNTRGAARP